ncbi:unnamed protein product [Notodromas monacha]|uniref:Uncharacterized protein n=1 Tax=Notodromas monacha TaxID=399045 RepID=A0A7R9BYG5_9CRUS|nr:unnamed protein product [Notodromas monacha]CAG0922935.1 unnamed protein product [Notodromas monacha]
MLKVVFLSLLVTCVTTEENRVSDQAVSPESGNPSFVAFWEEFARTFPSSSTVSWAGMRRSDECDVNSRRCRHAEEVVFKPSLPFHDRAAPYGADAFAEMTAAENLLNHTSELRAERWNYTWVTLDKETVARKLAAYKAAHVFTQKHKSRRCVANEWFYEVDRCINKDSAVSPVNKQTSV